MLLQSWPKSRAIVLGVSVEPKTWRGRRSPKQGVCGGSVLKDEVHDPACDEVKLGLCVLPEESAKEPVGVAQMAPCQ